MYYGGKGENQILDLGRMDVLLGKEKKTKF